jgi:DNA-binding response OmpR family regulator
MKYHALVVDDNPAILQDLKDRLDSLGHSCDCVDSQNLARKYIVKNGYSYVLLDLEIPVQYGRPSRIQNGKNLILDIRSIKGHENFAYHYNDLSLSRQAGAGHRCFAP